MQLEIDILKSAFSDPDRLRVLLGYGAEIFSDDKNKTLYNIFADANEEGLQLDLPLLYTRLPLHGFTQDETQKYILDFAAAYPVINIGQHIQELIKRNQIETIRCKCVDLFNGIKAGSMQYDNMIEHINNLHEGLNRSEIDSGKTIAEVATQSLDDLYHRENCHKSGIQELDDKIFGIFNTQLVVIAARPGLGKSAVSWQIAENISGQVLFFSLEMKRKKLYARYLSRHARVESWKVEHKKLSGEEASRVIKIHGSKARECQIKVYDNIDELSKIISIINNDNHAKAVIIDYLQLISCPAGQNRNLEISDITRRLKKLAMKKNIPIIILSQLNRGIEYQDREPVLADLRESGAIEQDADIVIFIHAKKHEGEWGDTFFIVAKNRDGAVGRIKTYFERKYYTFGIPFVERQVDMGYIHD